MNRYVQGVKAGIPIGLGYFAVSAAFGMAAVIEGLSVHEAILISLTNLTSAGQFAGTALLATGATLGEIILTQLVINARYFLMSVSLSQKVPSNLSIPRRMLMSFAITDEIYAVCVQQEKKIEFIWFAGLATLPILGWTAGTALGAVASHILPESLVQALGLAMYAMFVAIVIPEAKKNRTIAFCALLAAVLSCIFTFTPFLSSLSSGYVIVIVTLVSAGWMAWKYPIVRQGQEEHEPAGEMKGSKLEENA